MVDILLYVVDITRVGGLLYDRFVGKLGELLLSHVHWDGGWALLF